MFDRRRRLACLLIAFALSPWASAVADPPATAKPASKAEAADLEADDELLEFLGSVDKEEDGELIDYYAKAAGSKAEGAKPEGSKSKKTTENHE